MTIVWSLPRQCTPNKRHVYVPGGPSGLSCDACAFAGVGGSAHTCSCWQAVAICVTLLRICPMYSFSAHPPCVCGHLSNFLPAYLPSAVLLRSCTLILPSLLSTPPLKSYQSYL
eukprot:6209789-Pleurochrysis_carterae.AAC.6